MGEAPQELSQDRVTNPNWGNKIQTLGRKAIGSPVITPRGVTAPGMLYDWLNEDPNG
jgi:hypothetical protein